MLPTRLSPVLADGDIKKISREEKNRSRFLGRRSMFLLSPPRRRRANYGIAAERHAACSSVNTKHAGFDRLISARMYEKEINGTSPVSR